MSFLYVCGTYVLNVQVWPFYQVCRVSREVPLEAKASVIPFGVATVPG